MLKFLIESKITKFIQTEPLIFKTVKKYLQREIQKQSAYNEITITANRLSHDKNANVTEAMAVKIVDTKKDYVIFADKINYFKDQEKITINGDTKATEKI